MPMLDAALAFALTMLAVASIVSAIVGKIGASATYRRDMFQDQLKEFYDRHVKDVVDEKLELAEGEADERANAAVAKLMAQMKIEGKVELSTKDLMAGLAKTELGGQLTAKVSGELDEVAQKLGAAWEQVGDDFSARFRERARLASLVVGIVVAGVLNVDSIYIIETYVTDEDVLSEALGQQDAMLTQYAAFLSTQPQGEAVDSAQADIASIKADIDFLKGSGVPLGWDHMPLSRCEGADGLRLPRCGAVAGGAAPTARDGWLLWILGILVTGYLAGLGSPFWYDLVSGISHVAQAKRGSRQRNAGGAEAAAG